MADEPQLPTEDELREALDQIGVSDILLNALSAVASIGFRRVSAETRDLDQVRLAIESLRALDPVLREGGVDESIVRDLEQARANLQLAYANAVQDSDIASYTEQPQTEEELQGADEATRQMIEEEPW